MGEYINHSDRPSASQFIFQEKEREIERERERLRERERERENKVTERLFEAICVKAVRGKLTI